jgi:hypothetical protein
MSAVSLAGDEEVRTKSERIPKDFAAGPESD